LFTAEYPKAFVEINTVLRANVYNPEAYFLKGMCYKNMGDTNKAISSFQTAVQTDPKFTEGYMQLALIHEARKNPLALQYYENAYRADPSNMEALYGEGMYWQNQEKMEEAKKVYRRMIGLDRGYPKSYYNLGWILLQQDSVDKALRQFEFAIQNQPDYGDAWYNKGLCLEILGNKKEAQASYEQAQVFLQQAPYVKEALQRIK
jgi:tetratricopeptide (TPR) repeat protein